jgi:hypothetical protein
VAVQLISHQKFGMSINGSLSRKERKRFIMKEKSLKHFYHYNKSEKTYEVRVDLDQYRDVYSEWDYAPMINRDLDEDLIEFLLEGSYEIGLSKKMKIVFFIPKNLEDQEKEKKSVEGMRHYFDYQMRRVKGQVLRKLKISLIFLIIGFAFLILAGLSKLYSHGDFFSVSLSEGLYIGAWVALWEIFSIWFFQISDLRRKIKHFKRLNNIEIKYLSK